jgi:hypothetical protein
MALNRYSYSGPATIFGERDWQKFMEAEKEMQDFLKRSATAIQNINSHSGDTG